MPKIIRVLLVEDHTVVREAFRIRIEKEPDMEVVGEAGDGREGISLALDVLPDVVVMDLSMPNLNGIEATRQITSACPEVKVLPLSMHTTKTLVTEMIRAGARGFMVKAGTSSELVRAIRIVARGQTYFSSEVAGILVDCFMGGTIDQSPAYSILSSREREVLQLLAEGKSVKEIAACLSISISTVETHRRHMKTKLNLDSLADLVRFAIREGLISLEA